MDFDEHWDEDPDAIMKSQTKHDWMSEPRFKKIFNEIEDGLQCVLGKGPFEWVDKRVFDGFVKSTLLAVHKLMQRVILRQSTTLLQEVRKLTYFMPHQLMVQLL